MRYIYVLTRSFGFFGLPFFKKIRNYVYSNFLKTPTVNVSDRVYIVSPHVNGQANIKVGEHVEFGKDTYIDYSGGVVIGNCVSISEGVKIYTHNHGVDGFVDWRKNEIDFSPLVIEDNCWLGAGSIILPNVTHIGKGAVVGAGSVVTKNVEEGAIVAGNPAKVVKYRNYDDQ